MSDWFEYFRKPGEKLAYLVERRLVSGSTSFQRYEVIDTAAFGRALILDESLQSAEIDEFAYHEALVHPAFSRLEEPRAAFIAGSGEGAVARELLKYPSVERVVMAEIDREVVELSRQHLMPWHRGAFDDERVEVIFDDAFEVLHSTDGPFDAVIVDITAPKPDNPGTQIYTQEFFRLAKEKLGAAGVLVTQSQSANVNNLSFLVSMSATLGTVFRSVRPFLTQVASFGDCWSFVLAGDDLSDPVDVDGLLSSRGIRDLRLYDAEADRQMFLLPKYVRAALAQSDPHISTTATPFQYGSVE